MPPANDTIDVAAVAGYFTALQDRICSALQFDDSPNRFEQDDWKHGAGGGGRTRVLRNGQVFEQAGVNFSHVQGQRLPKAATTRFRSA